MKKIIFPILITAFLFIVFGFVFNDGTDTPVALIKKIIKDVSYRKTDASDWEIAKTGTPLKTGEQIKTGYKSLALVLFTDGTGLLRVRENSTMYIYAKKDGKKLNKNTFLEQGVIGFEINKQEEEEFKFTTPTAVAAIRGTAGYLEVDSDSSTVIACEHGKIEVQARQGKKGVETVEGGFAVRVGADGNFFKGKMTKEQLEKFNKTKKTKTNKIYIDTDEGTIEIEYFLGQ